MRDAAWLEAEIEEILATHGRPPEIVRRDGAPLSAGERHCLLLRPEGYQVESPGLERLNACLLGLESRDLRDVFWDILRKRVRHPIVPCFFVAQKRMVHLLEGILDELDRVPFDEKLIVMASDALKIEHGGYSVEELEKIGELVGSLLTQSHLGSGQRSLAARRGGEEEIGPETMQAMRVKRNVYKALGTLQETVRAALYGKLEGMLGDS